MRYRVCAMRYAVCAMRYAVCAARYLCVNIAAGLWLSFSKWANRLFFTILSYLLFYYIGAILLECVESLLYCKWVCARGELRTNHDGLKCACAAVLSKIAAILSWSQRATRFAKLRDRLARCSLALISTWLPHYLLAHDNVTDNTMICSIYKSSAIILVWRPHACRKRHIQRLYNCGWLLSKSKVHLSRHLLFIIFLKASFPPGMYLIYNNRWPRENRFLQLPTSAVTSTACV
jgi:hypothetical protein